MLLNESIYLQLPITAYSVSVHVAVRSLLFQNDSSTISALTL